MSKKFSLLMTAAALSLFAVPAQAGFEWKGPLSAPVRQAPAASAQDGTAPAGGMNGLEPVIMWDGAAAPTPVVPWTEEVTMPAEKVEDVEKAAIGKDVQAEPAAVASAPAAAEDLGEEISGFGSDLPLVIALQQVVPAGYQFSFSSGANPGTLVSWEGGKPWKTVLSDMLASQGLGYRMQNNTVVIGYFQSEPAAPVAAPLSVKAESIPADMILQNDAAAVPAPSEEPVVIRRQKPSSLLKKEASEEASAVSAQATPATPERVLIAPRPAEVTASSGQPIALSDAQNPAHPQAPAPSWSGAKGQTLRDVIKNWSDVAGVELYWSIDYDYRLSDDVGYAGTYDEAVGKLLDRFATVRPQPYGQLHQSGDGPRVLVVKSYDLTK